MNSIAWLDHNRKDILDHIRTTKELPADDEMATALTHSKRHSQNQNKIDFQCNCRIYDDKPVADIIPKLYNRKGW